MWRRLKPVLQSQAQAGFAARRILAVFERERAAMSLGDLPAQHQPNAGSARFGREERDEEIRRIGKSWPVVLNDYIEITS